MKRLLALCALVLGGCSALGTGPERAPQPALAAGPAPAQLADANGVPIERVPFRSGVSSATVVKLARQHACTGGQGAGLVTEPGAGEGYRMQCGNGKGFLARCELRPCGKM